MFSYVLPTAQLSKPRSYTNHSVEAMDFIQILSPVLHSKSKTTFVFAPDPDQTQVLDTVVLFLVCLL